MTRIELVRISSSLLKVMYANDIKTSDVLYVEVYDDFIELRKSFKFSAVITELAMKYNKSERTISRMIARLQEEVVP